MFELPPKKPVFILWHRQNNTFIAGYDLPLLLGPLSMVDALAVIAHLYVLKTFGTEINF